MKTYYIITIGCQMNKSDSERIAGRLEDLGYNLTDNKNQSDLVVFNTCGVRQSAEDRIYGFIPKIKKINPKVKIILAGCLSERKDVKQRLKNVVDIWLPINKISDLDFQISGKIKNILKDDKSIKSKIDKCNYLKLEPKYKSRFSAFVPIGNGCNNFCAYCAVPYARGREVYRPTEDIIEEARKLIKNGYKEIVLIAQNVNSYKVKSHKIIKSIRQPEDKSQRYEISFADLLRMINDIPGDFWIRFYTSHPKDMSDELINIMAKCDKVCQHIHLPVQSGDNNILEKMNRKYNVEHYKNLIIEIRKAISNIAVTTDIVVGFPGETREQFNNTVKLFKEVKFDMAYISQYSPRPGTAAEKLEDDVAKLEKKRREEELMKILRKTALENNKKYIGSEANILIEGKNKKEEWYGKTKTSKNVKISSIETQNFAFKTENLTGKFVKVKIKKAKAFGLEGIIR